jgi:hypothetical protein
MPSVPPPLLPPSFLSLTAGAQADLGERQYIWFGALQPILEKPSFDDLTFCVKPAGGDAGPALGSNEAPPVCHVRAGLCSGKKERAGLIPALSIGTSALGYSMT